MRAIGRILIASVAVAGGLLGATASPASAHTGLDASDPADGEVVDGPLEAVVLDFTGTPTAIDDGIVVADGAGNEFVPVAITQEELRITARFDPALGAGSYALSWVVRSDDTHTIDGSFGFSVSVPVTPTTMPATTISEAAPATTEASTTPVATIAPTTTAAPVVSDPDVVELAEDEAAVAVPVPPPTPPAASAAVEDGESVARIGRLLLFPSAVVAVGVLAFAAFAFAGSRTDLGSLIRLVRWLGVGVALGALLEVVGLQSVFGGYGDLLDDAAGRAAFARIVAGVCLAVGLGGVGVAAARSLSAAVVEETSAPPTDAGVGPWRPGARDVVGLIGVVVLVVSFAFDGHTLSEGPRLLHALTSVVHVLAASVWAGGVVAFAVVLRIRHRRGAASHAVEMVLRFSVIAMVSLALAGLAGLVMAWFIESDLGAYASTEWGRLMLLKLALVVVAAALGGYNHFRLEPALEQSPADPELLARTRSTITAEGALLVGAALVTAVLVGASTI